MSDQDTRIADAIARLRESTATLTWPQEAKDLRAALRSLIQQWREEAQRLRLHGNPHKWAEADAIDRCADQLEHLITGAE